MTSLELLGHTDTRAAIKCKLHLSPPLLTEPNKHPKFHHSLWKQKIVGHMLRIQFEDQIQES